MGVADLALGHGDVVLHDEVDGGEDADGDEDLNHWSLTFREEVAEEEEGGELVVEAVDLGDLGLGGTGVRVEGGQAGVDDPDPVGDEEGGVGVDGGHGGLRHLRFLSDHDLIYHGMGYLSTPEP